MVGLYLYALQLSLSQTNEAKTAKKSEFPRVSLPDECGQALRLDYTRPFCRCALRKRGGEGERDETKKSEGYRESEGKQAGRLIASEQYLKIYTLKCSQDLVDVRASRKNYAYK